MVGRSPKSEKLDKRRGPSGHGDPARACRFKAASAPAGRETTRVIRAVQGEAGDKDRTELPVLAGSLTQPDHVAQKEGHERCPPYMSWADPHFKARRPIAAAGAWARREFQA